MNNNLLKHYQENVLKALNAYILAVQVGLSINYYIIILKSSD